MELFLQSIKSVLFRFSSRLRRIQLRADSFQRVLNFFEACLGSFIHCCRFIFRLRHSSRRWCCGSCGSRSWRRLRTRFSVRAACKFSSSLHVLRCSRFVASQRSQDTSNQRFRHFFTSFFIVGSVTDSNLMPRPAFINNRYMVTTDFQLVIAGVTRRVPQAVIAARYLAFASLNLIDKVSIVNNQISDQAITQIAIASTHITAHAFHVPPIVIGSYIFLRMLIAYRLALKACHGSTVKDFGFRALDIINAISDRTAKLAASILLRTGTSNRNVLAYQKAFWRFKDVV